MTSDCAFHGATGPTEFPKNSLGLMRSGQWRLDGVQTLIREAAYNNGEHWPNVRAQGSCRVSEQPLFGEALETGLGPSTQILDLAECALDKVRRCSGRCEGWLSYQSVFFCSRTIGQKKLFSYVQGCFLIPGDVQVVHIDLYFIYGSQTTKAILTQERLLV